MMKNKLLGVTAYLLFCLSGCNADTTVFTNKSDNTNSIKQELMRIEACSRLSFDKKILPDQYENTILCFDQAAIQSAGLIQKREVVDYVSKKILALDLPKNLLTKMLEATTAGISSNTELIKKLVERGASTRTISVDRIFNHNDIVCEPIEYIIENNKELYRTNSVFSKDHLVNARDIFSLADTYVAHQPVCVRAIEKLISYYPESINLNSNGTPLTHLLQNPEPAEVPPVLAVKLLSKTNVNMTDNNGNTAIHEYLLGNQHRGIRSLKKYQKVIDKFIELGGDLDLKNKNGVTVRELLSKNSLMK